MLQSVVVLNESRTHEGVPAVLPFPVMSTCGERKLWAKARATQADAKNSLGKYDEEGEDNPGSQSDIGESYISRGSSQK